MKHLTRFILLIAATVLTVKPAFSQIKIKPVIAVLNIESKGLPLDAQQMGNITRMELEKLDTFSVLDKYDVQAIAEKKQLITAGCYGKTCLVQIGTAIGAEYMLTGSAELYGQTIVITYRLIDVAKDRILTSQVMEFLNLPLEMQQMSGIAIRKMFGYPNDPDLVTRLTKKFNYESATTNPAVDRLNLQGPRLGFTLPFGEIADVTTRSRSQGGYDLSPFMFQFGYQFEVQYLNEGKFQALFEFLPMITGLEQQIFLPSLTFLNGFRNNVNGLEIAFGPSVSFASYADVANVNGNIMTKAEYNSLDPTKKQATEPEFQSKLDRRGTSRLSSALVIAVGRTIKSGKLNIPINVWSTFPTREGFRVGISVGYNSKR